MELHEVPRPPRRGLRELTDVAPQAAPADLNVLPKVLLDGVDDLADICTEMKVPLQPTTSEERAFEVVDPQALTLAIIMALPLAGSSETAAESGVSIAELTESSDRLDHMTSLYDVARDGEERCAQSLRVMGKVQRDARGQLDRAARRLLQGNELSEAEKRDLLRELRIIDREVAAQAEDRQAAAARTVLQRDKTEAALAEEQRREELLRTMLKLKRGGSVTPEEVQRAYADLTSERRDSTRR